MAETQRRQRPRQHRHAINLAHRRGRISVTLHTLHKQTTIPKRGQVNRQYATSQERVPAIQRRTTTPQHSNTNWAHPTSRTVSPHPDQLRVTAQDLPIVTAIDHRRCRSIHSALPAPGDVTYGNYNSIIGVGGRRSSCSVLFIPPNESDSKASAGDFSTQAREIGAFHVGFYKGEQHRPHAYT